MTDYGPEFTAFWSVFPHPQRPYSQGSKKQCWQYWIGGASVHGRRRIKPEEWPEIMEAAMVHAEDAKELERVPMCQTWMFQERWETVLEARDEQERIAQERETPSGRREAYHAWKVREQARGGIATLENFDKHMASRPKLKVVGE